VRFALLGSLTVMDDTRGQVTIAGARQRALLACLLARANTPVSYDALIDAVWEGRRAADSQMMVRSTVMRLRQALGPDLATRIVARAPGYLIRVEGSELDILSFEALCRDAGAAVRAGRWADAERSATEALALWRGEPLLDVAGDRLREQIVPGLEQLRLQALEDGARAELHLGRHERLIPRLRDLTARHPLHEHFHAQLVIALARSGRQAEALASYRDARRTLVDQLGIEPGPELRDLHRRILAGDTDLLAPPRSEQASGPAAVPRQLPAGVRHFVGREAELKALSEQLNQATESGGTVVVSAIGGAAGIGKTSLAVHWARRHADRFPDGHFYVNLRGFDPSGEPMAASEAVRGFLTALGVPAARIPVNAEDRVALYRSRMADRRMLILLDNARDAGQVRPLLPGSSGSLVLVTSRDQLGGLVAVEEAVPVRLDVLTASEARDLLTRRLGPERVLVDEGAVTELIEVCARLPLALSIVAARAALHPARSLTHVIDELRDARGRLDLLTVGDDAADVRAVFSWSYRTLDPGTARVFRLLGVHPGPDIGVAAAAGLTALDPARTRRALDSLTAAHLLTERAPGRYDFHDLLRAYAADQAGARDSEPERTEALRRACDFYLHTGYAADRLLAPFRPPIVLSPAAPGVVPHPPPDDPSAMAWFEAEHANLLAAQRVAAAHEWHRVVWQLAWTLTSYHFRHGQVQDELAVWQAALAATEHLPDPHLRPLTHRLIGHACTGLGRHQEAIEHLERALLLSEQEDDPAEQAHTHALIAYAWDRKGDDARALRHATRCLELYRALGQPALEAQALNGVGWFTARLGDYEAAREHCQAALALHRSLHDRGGEAQTLDSLGYIAHHTGHHEQAVAHYRQALALHRGLDRTHASADSLDGVGHPYLALGCPEKARTAWHEALNLYRQQGRTHDAERIQQQLDALP